MKIEWNKPADKVADKVDDKVPPGGPPPGHEDFRDWLCQVLGCKGKPPKPPKPNKDVFVWVFLKLRRERINTKPTLPMKIEDIPVGYQDIYEGKADEPIENPKLEMLSGGADASVQQKDPTTIEVTFRGEGGIGPSSCRVTVDGHIGDGDVPIVTEFEWNVVSADATTVGFTKVRREQIPKSK